MRTPASKWLNDQTLEMAALVTMEAEKSALLDLTERLGQVGHWWVSLPDYTVRWSAEVFQIHGLAPNRLAPDLPTAIGFYHPGDQDIVAAAIATAARDGTAFDVSARLIRADGALRHVKSRGLTIAGPDGLPAKIFGVFVDITEEWNASEVLRDENAKLEKIAYVDALTGLANRRHFDETLHREWLRATREETTLSLIMLDIDRFKRFNDLYGHPAGDACLRLAAVAVAAVFRRPGDLLARYGGEEFAMILPGTEAAGAEKLAHEVRAAIEALGLTHAGNPHCGSVVTASLGVATAYPHPASTPSAWLDLITQADEMLYEAKRTGRNRVVLAAGLAAAAALPENETDRLAALAVYERAGATARTAEMDRIARLAAMLTASPIGLVTLVAKDAQYFSGNFGMEEIEGTPRDVSFCAHTILGDEPLVVGDATLDSRFNENALITGDFGLKYYAGAPIISASGHRLGALCIIDKSARAETSPAQRALLTDLAKMAANLLEDKVREGK
jgi:diguanylate cyclase (GGDEF)-like protein